MIIITPHDANQVTDAYDFSYTINNIDFPQRTQTLNLKFISEHCFPLNFIYTTSKKYGVRYLKKMSLKCLPRLHLFDQKYSKNSNIVKYYYNLKEMFSVLTF